MKPLAIAFIPVRKDSKGIPGKNIRPFAGKPLLSWVLDSLLSVESLDQIWIATDCDNTGQLIKENYNNQNVNVFRRSPESARDNSPVIMVILEFLEKMNYPRDTLFLLAQATSPFTAVSEFAEAINCIGSGDFDSAISCVRLKKYCWSASGMPLNYDIASKQRRQEFEGFLVESGSFYASNTGRILQTGQLISGKIRVLEVSNYNQIDLDEQIDWIMGEALMNYLISAGIK